MPFFSSLKTKIRSAIAAREERKISARFTARPRADHALIVNATAPRHVPNWRQLRYAGLVFSGYEQRLILIAAITLLLAGAAAGWIYADTHVAHIPASGGTIIEAVAGSPKGINPLYASANDPDADLVALVFAALFRRTNGVLEPELAKSHEWSADGTRLTITLKEGATFHDGMPLTSQDVLFTLQSAQDPAWRSPASSAFRDATFAAPDESTIVISLGQADASFLDALTLGILPAHLWGDIAPQTASLANANVKPVGAGPFMVENFRHGANGNILSYRLKRFDGYAGAAPRLHAVEFRFFPDPTAAEDAVRGGQADLVAFVRGMNVKKFPSASFGQATLSLPEESIAFFNVNDALLNDRRVREALAISVDREDVIAAQAGFAEAASGPYPSLALSASASSTEERLAQARQLLDAAGWTLPPNTDVRLRSGAKTSSTTETASSTSAFAFTIAVPDTPDLVAVANVLAKRWSLLNARVTVAPEPAASLLARATRDRDLQVILWNILLSPSEDLYPIWWSGQADGNGLNLSNLKDRDVDAALKAVGTTSSTEALAVARQAVNDAILTRTPAAFLTRPVYAYVFSKRVKGISEQLTLGVPSDRFADISNWYVKTKWAWR